MVDMRDEKAGSALSRNGIQVIARAAGILRTLRDDPEGLSLGQISERVGLARSTVQRIVGALQDERLVIVTGKGGIRLGPEITSLASAAHFDVVEICRPSLVTLVKTTGETVDLSVLRGGRMIFLDQVQGTHRLRTVSAVGDVFPLTTTANGKAALSILDRQIARRIAEAEFTEIGHPGNWDRIAAELDLCTRTGFAYDINEHSDGISAVGCAFRDPNKLIHAISVPIPSSRFERARKKVETELARAVTRARSVLETRSD
jgi:DNA-binding IclR family transcriptional regulator